MDVSIIIVNYNTQQLTMNCIDSVFEKTKDVEFEVILVDNASTDGSRDIFEKDSRIKYIYSEANLGFGKGNNLGYQYARGKYILLLNSDTLLINNAVYELVNFMEIHPEVSIAGGALFNSEMERCTSYGLLLPSLKQELDTLFRGFFSRNLIKRMNREIATKGFAYIGYVTGADMMLRRERIEEIGMFDSDFFMYYEETEMTSRYVAKGYKSAFFPNAKIQHLEGKSFAFKETREKMFFTSRRLYFQKTGHGKLYYYLCTCASILYLLTSALKNIIVKNEKQSASNSMQRLKVLIHS